MSYRLGSSSINKLKDVSGFLVEVVMAAITESPYDFGICQGKRTAEQQNKIFLSGNSQKDGYKKLSKHQFGNAVDFFAFVDGKASWNVDYLEVIWKHMNKIAKGKMINLRWGGDWDQDGIRVDRDRDEGFLDAGHIELGK